MLHHLRLSTLKTGERKNAVKSTDREIKLKHTKQENKVKENSDYRGSMNRARTIADFIGEYFCVLLIMSKMNEQKTAAYGKSGNQILMYRTLGHCRNFPGVFCCHCNVLYFTDDAFHFITTPFLPFSTVYNCEQLIICISNSNYDLQLIFMSFNESSTAFHHNLYHKITNFCESLNNKFLS